MILTIDNEFKSLIPSPTPEERAGLEESIKAEGCRDALVTWNGILVDGHNRYDICARNGIPFKTVEMQFESRDAAMTWIIKNQFSRRNILTATRCMLAGKLEEIVARRNKEKADAVRRANGGDRKSEEYKNRISQPVGERDYKADHENQTAEIVAKSAGISRETYRQFKQVQEKAPEPVKQSVMSGETSIKEAYRQVKEAEKEEKEPEPVKPLPHIAQNSGNNEWYTPTEYIEAARRCMGSIDTDPASNDIAQQTVKAGTYYTIENSGLEKEWRGNVWLNPPYAADLIGKFIDKLKVEREHYEQAIALVNNATETQWFSELVSIASCVCFLRSRVKFYMPDGKTGAPLQGQAALYIGRAVEDFIQAFGGLGWIATIKEGQ